MLAKVVATVIPGFGPAVIELIVTTLLLGLVAVTPTEPPLRAIAFANIGCRDGVRRPDLEVESGIQTGAGSEDEIRRSGSGDGQGLAVHSVGRSRLRSNGELTGARGARRSRGVDDKVIGTVRTRKTGTIFLRWENAGSAYVTDPAQDVAPVAVNLLASGRQVPVVPFRTIATAGANAFFAGFHETLLLREPAAGRSADPCASASISRKQGCPSWPLRPVYRGSQRSDACGSNPGGAPPRVSGTADCANAAGIHAHGRSALENVIKTKLRRFDSFWLSNTTYCLHD